jgi:sn-glycerol 3-phosphate transport system permease protein
MRRPQRRGRAALNGQARFFQIGLAALYPAGAADRDHRRFFLPARPARRPGISFQLQDAFGLQTEFVGLRNFKELFADSHYLDSFRITALFSALVATIGIAIALVLATMADRVLRGALAYKTLLIWPYAVAPAVAGVLWAFLFAPSIGIITYVLKQVGIDWNWVLQGDQAMLLVVIASTWKQISYNFLFFLAGLQSIPRSLIEAAAIDGAGPEALLDRIFPAALADHLLPPGGEHRLRLLRHLRRDRRHDPGRPGRRDADLVYKAYYDGVKAADLGGSSAQSVVLMLIVIALTVVQFRFVERKVQY